MQTSKRLLVLSLLLALSFPLAQAQDSTEAAPSAGSTAGGDAAPAAPPGPPLEGLFTPPIQYPTPQSQQNPTPTVGEGENPIKNLFNIQPQYPNSQTQAFPTPEAPKGTDNHLQGFFTGQNPFKTPQTPENPQPVPKNYIPNFGKDPETTLLQKDGDGGLESTAIGAGVNPAADSKDPKDADKDAKDKDGKSKDAKAKDKDGKDKDGKDVKDKDGKDTDNRLIGKDGKIVERDKDGKPIQKDKDGKPIEKTKDKDGKDATTSDGKDKAGPTAEDKAKEEKSAAEEKEKKAENDAKEKALKAAGPYNPLQEAIFLMNNGQHQEAITALAKILKARPGWAEAHYVTAVTFVAMRQYKHAADEYNLVLRLVPTTPLAQMALQGLQKIGEPARPTTKYPPLHSSAH